MSNKQENSMAGSDMTVPKAGTSRETNNDAFYVDTALIPQASLDDQSSELRELGLSVFNQDVFEEEIMNQVDDALAKEEEVRLKKILHRELTTINDDIKLAETDLAHVEKSEFSIESLGNLSRDDQKHLESIRRQKKNKLKQLDTLSVRQENVKKKIKDFETGTSNEGQSTFDKAFKVGKASQKESPHDRMVRMGEMTPFGTVMKTNPTHKPKLSGFEKLLLAKESPIAKVKKDFRKYLKKKSSESQRPKESKDPSTSGSGPQKQQIEKENKRNRFDEKDWRVYDKEKSYRGQRRVRNYLIGQNVSDDVIDDDDFHRDPDEMYGVLEDEDEYVPHENEFDTGSSDEDDFSDETPKDDGVGKKRKKKPKSSFVRKRPRPLPVYRENSDEEEPVVKMKVKRDRSIRLVKDDADPEAYQKRLFKQQKADKVEEREEQKIVHAKNGNLSENDSSQEDESEFEGGLRVPQKLWKKLYKYQRTGVRWLWELHLQQAGGIVGDEMGLGKTIQTISFLAALRTSKVRNVNFPYKGLGPTIIVCPTTVMHQWVKEFHKWWPDFRVAILHSSGSFVGSESAMIRSVAKGQGILITSFNTLVIHQELVLRFNWHYVILDEGHKIRNPDAKVTLCCKQFRTPHRIILSGSPIQNNLKELWSLFDFVFPGKLGTLPDFMQHFSVPIVQGGYSNATQIQVETAYRCACVLRDTINPYLIRRMKADVKQSLALPNKNEQVLFCRLTDEQRDVYEEYLNSRECRAILQGKFQVFSGLITLRKICNHPDLSTGGPQLFQGESLPTDPEFQFGYWKRSGKMIVVEALLRLWNKQGHRVLLFSQSKAMLNILEKFVQDQGFSYLRMDGGTSISARQPLISQYNDDPSIFIFLLTTRVGGLGVNLTGADRVIIFDPDWNPSTDMQARERAWRIGQRRQVTIYRLLTSGSLEEKIYHRQIFKQFLTNRILKDPKQRRLFQSQDMFDLFTLSSKDNTEGTETSALFAGTGCDVAVPVKKRMNRFDEIKDQKEREKEESLERGTSNNEEKDAPVLREDEEVDDKEELEQMRELARRLSRKMEEAKQRDKQFNEANEQKETAEENSVIGHLEDGEVAHDDGPNMSTSSSQTSHNTHRATGSGSNLQGCSSWDSSMHKKKFDKKWKIPSLKKEVIDIKKEVEDKEETKIKSKDLTKDSRAHEHSKKSRSTQSANVDKDKKRKRKQKDARFEGEKIPHLVKHCEEKKRSSSHENQEDDTSRQHDDIVLRELFKKTGIQGAMKHDRIMDSSKPDFAIVEAEAEKVAREAAAALRRSRQHCSSAMSGQPSWTGQHGAKPRFGQKKNSLLSSKSAKTTSSSAPDEGAQASENPKTSQQKEKDRLFDGTVSGNISLNPKDNSLSSDDLLSKMRSRKRISSTFVDESEDDFLRPDPHQQTLDPKDEELLRDIHNYIAFMATRDGEASTQEIVLNFGSRLPKSDAPKFKAMLNQICDFHGGRWRLKIDYR